ncbi:hypothetical protein HPP92_008685 [Vanilla planifolia]|uniref:WRKY domain-containing protein n=1 Tax=Vanilla planifolia TaxID=51239 RepID=A0A835R8I7_VANPL|nr:hypothetical protein HPP92_008685 [Vanilla planifolia]
MLPTGVLLNHEGTSSEISHTPFSFQPLPFPHFAAFPPLGPVNNPFATSINPHPWACRAEEGIQQNDMRKSSEGSSIKTSEGVKHKHNWVANNLSVGGVRMKRVKTRRKVRDPRFCFKTMSEVDVLDDGYKWRKYGQKVVKNTQHPRSYYRCTQDNCRVKKRVERLAEDPRMVITTYEGRHAHSPSRDDQEPSQRGANVLW